jgi:asparagine N-glycosylation enzyme membrane subunit Stt3
MSVGREPIKFCYIFDYSNGEIYRITVPKNITTDYKLEEFLVDNYGLKLSNITYMTVIGRRRVKILDNRNYLEKAKSFKNENN